jgi:uncharacterized protein (TIGR00299 family) protein
LPPPLDSPNRPLAEGSGSGMTLLLDTPSGISGDMTVAALIDLGVPFELIESTVASLGLDGVRVRVEPARAGALGGTRFVVDIHGPQPERRYAEIDGLLASAPIREGCRTLARRIIRRLAEAESEVHRVPLADVAFHEVGAGDAIADIVAASAGFAHLGASVIATPLPLGRGFVRCQHGRLPLPAPATLLCLRGVPTYPSGLDLELVTPTGAAILATVAEEFRSWPAIAPERVGVGCGTRVLSDRPNALRAILGRALPGEEPGTSHVLLEANVDDMTGELAAHAIEALLGAGALDAWVGPVTMKKGRPGLVLCAIAERVRADGVGAALLRETSSIGLRKIPVSRMERPRRIVEVQTAFGLVPIKVSEGPYGPPQVKPEFDACANAARSAGVTVREVLAAALAAYAALEEGPR